jgi:hypothetical protein
MSLYDYLAKLAAIQTTREIKEAALFDRIQEVITYFKNRPQFHWIFRNPFGKDVVTLTSRGHYLLWYVDIGEIWFYEIESYSEDYKERTPIRGDALLHMMGEFVDFLDARLSRSLEEEELKLSQADRALEELEELADYFAREERPAKEAIHRQMMEDDGQ